MQLPKHPLVTIQGDTEGNPNALISRVCQALQSEGHNQAAKEYKYMAHNCDNHDRLLSISKQYAKFEG